MYDGVGYSPIRVTNHEDVEVTFPLWQYAGAVDEAPGSRIYLVNALGERGSSFLSKETATQVEAAIQAAINAVGVMGLPGLPNVTQVGNVGAGEDDLMSYSIPAGTFAADRDMAVLKTLHSIASEDLATLKAYLGGTALRLDGMTQEIQTGGIDAAGEFVITRIDPDSILVEARIFTTDDTLVRWSMGAPQQIDSIDFDAALVFKTTGEPFGTADNEVVQKLLAGSYWPAK